MSSRRRGSHSLMVTAGPGRTCAALGYMSWRYMRKCCPWEMQCRQRVPHTAQGQHLAACGACGLHAERCRPSQPQAAPTAACRTCRGGVPRQHIHKALLHAQPLDLSTDLQPWAEGRAGGQASVLGSQGNGMLLLQFAGMLPSSSPKPSATIRTCGVMSTMWMPGLVSSCSSV